MQMYKYETNILQFKLNVITSQFQLVNLFEFTVNNHFPMLYSVSKSIIHIVYTYIFPIAYSDIYHPDYPKSLLLLM